MNTYNINISSIILETEDMKGQQKASKGVKVGPVLRYTRT